MSKKFTLRAASDISRDLIPPSKRRLKDYASIDAAVSEIMQGASESMKETGAFVSIKSIKGKDDSLGSDSSNQYTGSYRLLRLLGRGGSSSVYLGEHRYLKRLAAIKILHTVLNDQDKEYFIDEAKLLAKLSHPHIVRVLEFAVAQRPIMLENKKYMEYIPYLVMDFAHNGSLRALYPMGSRLPIPTALKYIKQVAIALEYAHEQGIIHRDVKPENILLNRQEEVMLSDFGLALFAPVPGLLSVQEMAGTLPYTAPEQLQGKPVFASDQYSLAIIAYEWLCGHHPFEGEDIDIIMQHISTPPPRLHTQNPLIPQSIETVIFKALAKDPQQRYPSVQAFAMALERASREHGKSAAYSASPQTLVKVLPSGRSETNNETIFSSSDGEAESIYIGKAGRRGDAKSAIQTRRVKKKQVAALRARIGIGIVILVLLVTGINIFKPMNPFQWLYPGEIASTNNTTVAQNTSVTLLGLVDFTVSSTPRVQNITLVMSQTFFQRDHSTVSAGGKIVIDFTLPESRKSKLAAFFIRGLISPLGANSGMPVGIAPINLYCNTQTIVQNFTLPGDGLSPNEVSIQIPPGQLQYGKNEIVLQVATYAQSLLWLYSIGVTSSLSG